LCGGGPPHWWDESDFGGGELSQGGQCPTFLPGLEGGATWWGPELPKMPFFFFFRPGGLGTLGFFLGGRGGQKGGQETGGGRDGKKQGKNVLSGRTPGAQGKFGGRGGGPKKNLSEKQTKNARNSFSEGVSGPVKNPRVSPVISTRGRDKKKKTGEGGGVGGGGAGPLTGRIGVGMGFKPKRGGKASFSLAGQNPFKKNLRLEEVGGEGGKNNPS